MGQIRSARRRFRLTEPVCFDHGADAHVIVSAFRNFFDTRHPSPPAYRCMGVFFAGRQNKNRIFIPTLSPWPILKEKP
jgi:hypothetical protein